MLISEAKAYIGHSVKVQYKNRNGDVCEAATMVYDVNFVPLYGPCLITDVGDIRLDRVVGCQVHAEKQAA